ncbi:hypothetical protein GlitD10_1700 [Gloeomargarita lithophora Alchichica-D10]|uniref:Uncharacterized protein n=1 Tax=Gloeomargarita lithophora Alchichica-D10 TaxID=1188229 RepID=A0A1J0ADM7_9CYAN|nr:hypothetical protein [Gloeomargarita lithophora]APB34025.1 hypothetical protein GlitD10_1700 [Gloeomargarita lithophora Alchichica-D10]
MSSHRFSQDKGEAELAGLWSKKYVSNLLDAAWSQTQSANLPEKVNQNLRFASSQAWTRTETLLAGELQRHRLDSKLIDPWKIASDSQVLIQRVADAYIARISPSRFYVQMQSEVGAIRQSYTARDPRVLGFMSMQFHYTGLAVLDLLSPEERLALNEYLKVLDDLLYLPLQRTYVAAAGYEFHAPPLVAVRELLPLITEQAEGICANVSQQLSGYTCYSGTLDNLMVRVSSVRDVEMFQMYLCLVVLEGNLSAIQAELFPLCVMLYPPLRVNWSLVRLLVTLLDNSMQHRLSPASYGLFRPNLQVLEAMFSPETFPDEDSAWDVHPDTVRFLGTATELLRDLRAQT